MNNELARIKLDDKKYAVLSFSDEGYSLEDLINEDTDNFKLVEGISDLNSYIEDNWENYNLTGQDIFDRNRNITDLTSDLKRVANRNNTSVLPVYIYRHSGVVYSPYPITYGNQFDGGLIPSAFLMMNKDYIKKLSCKKIVLNKYILLYGKGFLENMTTVCNGEVYDFLIIDEDDLIIDSCSGLLNFDNKSYEDFLKELAESYF
jgi:hypothetical protein